MPYGPHSTSGPPGGGATSQGSGRDFSPPARDYSPPVRDHHPGTPVAIVQDQRTGEVKVVNVPSNEDLLKGDILQGPDLPVTGVEGPPSIISGPQVLPGADPHGDFKTFIQTTEPRLGADILTEGDIGYEIPYDYPEYDEKGNIIKYNKPTFEGGTGGEGVYTPPVTQADVTPPVEIAEETGLTEAELQENIDKYRAMYGENVPVDIQEFAAPVENPLVDQRMYRPYEENIQLMTAADGGRAGYKYGEFVSPHTEDDDEETIRAQALASLPQYQLFSQRRKAALGGRMNYNQGGIVALRQPAAFGGIMGPDGRRGYFLGSIGKIFKKVTKPIKKIIKSPIGKAALMYAGLSGLGSIGAGKTGWERFAPEMFKKGLSKINPLNWGSEKLSTEEIFKKGLELNAKQPVSKQLTRNEIWDLALAESKKQASSMTGMDIAAAVGIPAVMAGTAAYTTGTEQDDTADMNKYLAEQDKLVDPFRVKYGKTVPTDFQTLPYTFAAQGGRIGYRGGKGVTSLQAGAPDIKYEGNMRMASYGYDDAMGESWEEYKRLQKKGVIPIDMEFEEFLDLQQGGGFLEGRAPGRAPDRAMAQEGGLMDLGGMEKDYRQEGGFVPIGGQEKADDVPARLSKNEFVFTADAERAAGGGDVDAGADKMYNTMKQLESRVG